MRHSLKLFFRKFEVTAFLFTKLYTDSEKIVLFFRKGCRLPTCLPHAVKASHLPTLLLISSREAGCKYKLFSSFGLTKAVIEPKSTVSTADALSTRLMIKMLLCKDFITVLLYTECYAALLIRFSIAKYTILRMKPIVKVFQKKTRTVLYYIRLRILSLPKITSKFNQFY